MSDLTEEEIDSLIGGGEDDALNLDAEMPSEKEGSELDSLDALVGDDVTPDDKKTIRSATLSPLKGEAVPSGDGNNKNMRLLMDVPMRVSVELGRATRTVKDILMLNIGSVVELDKLSGEPVDLLVNGRIIAKAEVVIIDENFGIRITEILNVEDRLVLE